MSKPRILVLTDIGGDPDDEQSLIRLLVFANEFEIEGIIPQLWAKHEGRHGPLTPTSQMDLVRQMLGHYGKIHSTLLQHSADYPTEDFLGAKLKRGTVNVPHASVSSSKPLPDVSGIVGTGLDTEGSEWIIQVVDRPDPRPVDVNVWGGPADLAQALWKVRDERNPADLNAFLAKIRVHAIGDQDDTGPWIRQNFPSLFYILDHARDGDKMHSCYRGMFLGGDESLTDREWIDQHVRNDHGPLGAFYPPKTWTGPNPYSCLKEGDTPSWFYFLKNGLHVPSEPGFGGWGGRFSSNGTFYQDAEDTVGDETSHRATVWRWRPAFQNDFQARMDWCMTSYSEANHHPIAVVNGDGSRRCLCLSGNAGESVHLDASASHDPDGDTLAFNWWVYREAGTYRGDVTLQGKNSAHTSVKLPLDAMDQTIHVILEVADDGTPSLTSYRRVVIAVSPLP